jgi:hypothetical protein
MRQPTRTIEWAVEHYILSRSGRRPVSTRNAIRALRTVMHDCALSDRELTDLVAKCAVQRRLDVNLMGTQISLQRDFATKAKYSEHASRRARAARTVLARSIFIP